MRVFVWTDIENKQFAKKRFLSFAKIFSKKTTNLILFVAFFQIHTKNFHKNIFDNSITNTMVLTKQKAVAFYATAFC